MPKLRLLIIIALTITGAGFFAVLRFSTPLRSVTAALSGGFSGSADARSDRGLISEVRRVLDSMETPDSLITVVPSESTVLIRAAIPRGRPVEWLIWRFSQLSLAAGYKTEDCLVNDRYQTFTLTMSNPHRAPRSVTLESRPSNRFNSQTGKMAILIESFDYETDKTTIEFLGFPLPLTFSLNPTDKKSHWVAQALDQKNKEVVISIPMESHFAVPGAPTAGVIQVHHSEQMVRKILDESMKSVPNYSGFISRNGSRALEDSRIMRMVLGTIQRRNGYFIDGGEARNSVAPSVSRELKVPFGSIQAMLPAKLTAAEVETRLIDLIAEAQRRGTLIVRAEASVPLIATLKTKIPALKQNGIKLVYLSEIVQHHQ